MGEKKVKLWQNLSCDKTQIVTKLKLGQKSSCDEAQIVTKIELWRKPLKKNLMLQNSNCDKTWELKLW